MGTDLNRYDFDSARGLSRNGKNYPETGLSTHISHLLVTIVPVVILYPVLQ